MSTQAFNNIALLGATGHLGKHILTALQTAGFTVTAIQRKDSSNTLPTGTKGLKVDLSSESDLTAAFANQDVVVSALPLPMLSSDKIWMQAAIAAGVKRIVPSEYSTNIDNELSKKLPIVKDKVEIRTYVESLATEGKIDWTSINNGPFLIPQIWTSGWMGPSIQTKTAILHDGGEQIVCGSTLKRIGEGVAKSLSAEHAAETKNQSVYVYSAPLSEKKVTQVVSKITGIEFQEKNISIESVIKDAYAAIEKGDMSKMMSLYIPFCFGDGYGGDFRKQSWNERLGLKEMNDVELEATLRKALKGQ
jgi:hypothetical protein